MSDFHGRRNEWRAMQTGFGVQGIAFVAQLGGMFCIFSLTAMAFSMRGSAMSSGDTQTMAMLGTVAAVLMIGTAVVLNVIAGGLYAAGPEGRARGLGFAYLALAAIVLFEVPNTVSRTQEVFKPTEYSPYSGSVPTRDPSYGTYAMTLLALVTFLEVARLSTFGAITGTVGAKSKDGFLRVLGSLFAIGVPSCLLIGLLLNIVLSTGLERRDRESAMTMMMLVNGMAVCFMILCGAVLSLMGWLAVRNAVAQAELEAELASE